MSTATTTRISRTAPKGNVSVLIDPYDYYDATNKRPKSGFITTSVTGWATSGTGNTNETVHARMKFPDHDLRHAGAILDMSGNLNNGSYNPGQTFVTAWNYGQAGPSANVLPSGMVELVRVEIELLPTTGQADGAATWTLTYTNTFTEIDPYSALSSPTTGTLTASLKDQQVQDVNLLACPSVSGYSALAVRITTLDLERYGRCPRGWPAVAAFVPTDLGSPVGMYGQWLAAAKETVTFRNDYQWVFAVNNNLPDANSGNYRVGGGSATYSALALAMGGRPGDVATASLGYAYKLY